MCQESRDEMSEGYAPPADEYLEPPFDRVTINPDTLSGAPCIRGMRIPVSAVLNKLGWGESRDQLVADFPGLEPADIDQAIAYGEVYGIPGEDP